MAEVKNSFIASKMNKDLDARLIPNGEYRNAVNVSINKSTGENVGTAQTVLGNQELIDFNSELNASCRLSIIGKYEDDANNKLYLFLTGNNTSRFVPRGAVGTNQTPVNQGTTNIDAQLLNAGTGYTEGFAYASLGAASNFKVSSPIIFINSVDADGAITSYTIQPFLEYNAKNFQGETISIFQQITRANPIKNTPPAFASSASLIVNQIAGPISLKNGGSGYSLSTLPGTTTNLSGNGSGLTVSAVINSSGEITKVDVATPGSGYSINDEILIDGGNKGTIIVKQILCSDNFIVSVDLNNNDVNIIARGAFLNFSTLNPVYAVNLIEELLFFTDNRNQPRKVNVTRLSSINTPENDYYTTEDQISVAKYYPYEAIQLYQPSQINNDSIIEDHSIEVTNDSDILVFENPPQSNDPSIINGSYGVVGTAIAIVNGGTGYQLQNSLSTSASSGSGLTVNITEIDEGATGGPGVITGVAVSRPGQNYFAGEIANILGPGSGATISVNSIKPNTFAVLPQPTNLWPGAVKVNQKQTMPAGSVVSFVYQETTMQDAISEYYPAKATAQIDNIASVGNKFKMPLASYFGTQEVTSLLVYIKNPNTGVYEPSGGGKIISITEEPPTGGSGDPFRLVVLTENAITNQTYLAAGNGDLSTNLDVILSIKNPYFDREFKLKANDDYLNDKFVRFSYRYKFDDGEYSLIAPFTQICFIPQQDGYFLNRLFDLSGDPDNVPDTTTAYRSTEVDFMENKVNKILLNIPLPTQANQLNNDFKITEIDILYKESDQVTIKVVDSVPVSNNVLGDGFYYQYEYGSKQPFKTLPQDETVRVSDKVPVKALAQEVSSNRIIYGNYQDKHTPPKFLNYQLAAESKKDTFTITDNSVTDYTSSVEYPNAGLKQNRNYEVGVVLADRFGRQSTVILSETKLNFVNSFLASTLYSPYRTEEDNSETSFNPINGMPNFDGDSLKVQFNNIIQSFKDEALGTPGLYNGDVNSFEYNPLGWYSFKIVVKQTEQDYYNVYLPAAMAAYPSDPTKEKSTTCHVVLYNDNINKIPRNLQEVGPTQKEFGSSVRLFGRVNNEISLTGMVQYYPEKSADLVTTIGTIQDLFDYNTFPPLNIGTVSGVPITGEYVFYNFDYIATNTAASGDPAVYQNTFPDSSSLVARISTNKQFGVPIPASGKYSPPGTNTATPPPLLNVFETAPTVSLIDIYYETTTSGRIDKLNQAIQEGPSANIFSNIIGGTWLLSEDMLGTNSQGPADNQIFCTTPFRPVLTGDTEFLNPQGNTCQIQAFGSSIGGVTNLVSAPANSTQNIDGIPYYNENNELKGIFRIQTLNNGSFRIVLCLEDTEIGDPNLVPGLVVRGGVTVPAKASYTYRFYLVFDNPDADQPLEYIYGVEQGASLINRQPGFVSEFIEPVRPLVVYPQRPPLNDITFICCGDLNGQCGSDTVSITKEEWDLVGGRTGPFMKLSSTNGSGTQSLNKKDVNFRIAFLGKCGSPDSSLGCGGDFETIYDENGTTGPNSTAILDTYFVLENYGEDGFNASSELPQEQTLFDGAQAIIYVPGSNITDTGNSFGVVDAPQNNLESNVVYRMEIVARDGGDPAMETGCFVHFEFNALPVVQAPDDSNQLVPLVDGPNFVPFSPRYNISPSTSQAWFGNSDTPNNYGQNGWGDVQLDNCSQPFHQHIPFVLTLPRLQVLNADAEIRAVARVLPQGLSTKFTETPEAYSIRIYISAANDQTGNDCQLDNSFITASTQAGRVLSINIPQNAPINSLSSTTYTSNSIELPSEYGVGSTDTSNVRFEIFGLAFIPAGASSEGNWYVSITLEARVAQ